jgi:hypothetical protein
MSFKRSLPARLVTLEHGRIARPIKSANLRAD